jgi:hypothetical protein
VETPNPDPTKKIPILKAQRNKGQGKKGISIMEDKILEIFLDRQTVVINRIKCTIGKEKERIDKGKLAVKSKLINKENTVLIFDESDFARNGTTNFVKLQILAEKLGYKTIQATATFAGEPFSITMPKKGERKYMQGGLMPQYQDNDGNLVNINEKLANDKSFFFLPKAELTEEQEKILEEENVGYFTLDETLELASTGLTYGCPNGYIFFGDPRYGLGFTFNIGVCFSLVDMELKKLTKD